MAILCFFTNLTMGLGDLNGEPLSKIADLPEENHSSDLPEEDEDKSFFLWNVIVRINGFYIFYACIGYYYR